MRQLRLERVYSQARSSSQMLAQAQREAESLVDQTLSDDLLDVCLRLQAIVRACEQKRYRSPSPLSLR